MKASNRLSVMPRKVPKTYAHLPGMMSRAIQKYVEDPETLKRPKMLRTDDPRRIAPTISGLPYESTLDLVQKHKSRMFLEVSLLNN